MCARNPSVKKGKNWRTSKGKDLLAERAEYKQQYAETMLTLKELETQALNETGLEYYFEVSRRIAQMLFEQSTLGE